MEKEKTEKKWGKFISKLCRAVFLIGSPFYFIIIHNGWWNAIMGIIGIYFFYYFLCDMIREIAHETAWKVINQRESMINNSRYESWDKK
jgi:hypothetical protein